MMTSPNRGALYTGVTTDLTKRVWEHRNKTHSGFTAQYNCVMLVYYCPFSDITIAIAEEKRIKAGSRKAKEKLINSMNPDWNDLWDTIIA